MPLDAQRLWAISLMIGGACVTAAIGVKTGSPALMAPSALIALLAAFVYASLRCPQCRHLVSLPFRPWQMGKGRMTGDPHCVKCGLDLRDRFKTAS